MELHLNIYLTVLGQANLFCSRNSLWMGVSLAPLALLSLPLTIARWALLYVLVGVCVSEQCCQGDLL